MSDVMFRSKAFIHHWMNSRSRYHIHSPLVYHFCTSILPHQKSSVGNRIANRRKELMKNNNTITFTDYGASGGGKTVQRKLGEMIRSASRKRRSGELLHRICSEYSVSRGLELGTHAGIGTLYQVAGGHFQRFISLDGAEELSQIAQKGFRQWPIHVECLTGPFEETLYNQLKIQSLAPDYVFLDGNHRYEPSIEYFQYLLPHMADGGIMIWDDINWSKGMQRAWKEIISHPEVTVSIDLFFLGICFIRRNQAKEHFRLLFLDGNF